MPRLLKSHSNDGIDIMAMSPGELLFIRKTVSGTVNPFLRTRDFEPDGSKLLRFDEPTIVVVEHLHGNLLTAGHLRFARNDRRIEGLKIHWNAIPRSWPRLRAALRFVGEPHITVRSGFDFVLVYPDELAVEDDRDTNVTRGWIVQRDAIADLLEALPFPPRSRDFVVAQAA